MKLGAVYWVVRKVIDSRRDGALSQGKLFKKKRFRASGKLGLPARALDTLTYEELLDTRLCDLPRKHQERRH